MTTSWNARAFTGSRTSPVKPWTHARPHRGAMLHVRSGRRLVGSGKPQGRTEGIVNAMGLQQAPTEGATAHVTPRLISTLSVVERDGSTRRSLHVFCPMDQRTVLVDRCVVCPMCARLDPREGSRGRPWVGCTFPSRGPVPAVAGGVLARFAVSMRADAADGAVPVAAGVVPVVDHDRHLVGMSEPGSSRFADDGVLRLAVDERAPIPAAIAHMARRRVRQVPVVDGDGVLVGVLEDLDAMRALRGQEPEPR